MSAIDEVAKGDPRRGWPRTVGLTAATAALFWLPGRNHAANVLKLSFASLVVTGLFLWIGQTQFQGGASHFTDWADALASGGTLSMHVAQRSVGYPLLIWLTGYPYHHSIIPLLLLHALMAFSMPLLAYWTVAPASRATAYFVAAVLIVSLVPYAYMKFIYHDLPHIFLLAGFVPLAIRFSTTERWVYFWLALTAATLCSFTRPISMLLVPVYFGVALIYDWAAGRFRPRAGRRLLLFGLGAALFLAVWGANNLHRADIFGVDDGRKEQNYTGPQMFYPLYINSAEFGLRISPDIGPKTAAVFDYLKRHLSPVPEETRVAKFLLRISPRGHGFAEEYLVGYTPEGLIERMFDEPNSVYFHLMTTDFASGEGADIYLDSAIEIAKEHPWFIIRFLARNLYKILFDPGYGHSMWNAQPFHKQGLDFGIATPFAGASESTVRAGAAAEIRFSAFEGERLDYLLAKSNLHFKSVYTTFVDYVPWMMLFAGLLCLAALIIMPARHGTKILWRWFPRIDRCVLPVLLLSAVVLYHAMVIASTVEPYFRYHIIIFPLQIAAAGFSVVLLLDLAQQGVARLRQRFVPAAGRIADGLRRLEAAGEAIRDHAARAPLATVSVRAAAMFVSGGVLLVFAFYGIYMFARVH